MQLTTYQVLNKYEFSLFVQVGHVFERSMSAGKTRVRDA